MTDDKKHDDKDRKKVSDEELEEVAGGFAGFGRPANTDIRKGKKKGDDTSVTGMGIDGDDIKKKPGFRGDGVTKA